MDKERIEQAIKVLRDASLRLNQWLEMQDPSEVAEHVGEGYPVVIYHRDVRGEAAAYNRLAQQVARTLEEVGVVAHHPKNGEPVVLHATDGHVLAEKALAAIHRGIGEYERLQKNPQLVLAKRPENKGGPLRMVDPGQIPIGELLKNLRIGQVAKIVATTLTVLVGTAVAGYKVGVQFGKNEERAAAIRKSEERLAAPTDQLPQEARSE